MNSSLSRAVRILVAAGVLLGCFAGHAGAWYPRASQVELATATWCTWCPNAYAAVDSCKAWFGTHEFNAIRYYDTSGGLGNTDTQARISYYGGAGYPRAYFDGPPALIGSDSDVASGRHYRAALEPRLEAPGYFKITINSYDLSAPSGSIDLDIEVMEPVPHPASTFLRMALTEDNVTYGSHVNDDVTRDMLTEVAITVDELSEIQNVQQNFAINPAWIESRLKIVAFVQDDTDKSVMASAVTRPTPEYALRYYFLGDHIKIGPPSWNSQLYDFFHVFNAGASGDTYTISVTVDGPPDWSAVLCEEGICYGPVVTRSLDPGEEIALLVELIAPTSGYGVATVTMTQNNRTADMDRTLEFTYLTNDLEILVVDDDWVDDYEDYFTAALDFYGYSYGVWNRNLQAPTAADLTTYPIVIWSLGSADPALNPTLDAGDRAALGTFLDNGWRLLVTGQDLASDLRAQGGAAELWMQDYLHAIYVNEVASDRTLNGIPGDPISTELDLVIAGGDGADNQSAPDDIDPADGTATVIWTYDATRNAGLRIDDGNYQAVFLGFGFEAIDNAFDRRIALRRIIRWFQGQGGADDGAPLFRAALHVAPNPISAEPLARFTLPSAGPASLAVFGPDGRCVRTLSAGHLRAGNHVVAWDRLDEAGARVPAGVYYWKLDAPGANLARKTVVLR